MAEGERGRWGGGVAKGGLLVKSGRTSLVLTFSLTKFKKIIENFLSF
jgi:hypothetical protein